MKSIENQFEINWNQIEINWNPIAINWNQIEINWNQIDFKLSVDKLFRPGSNDFFPRKIVWGVGGGGLHTNQKLTLVWQPI